MLSPCYWSLKGCYGVTLMGCLTTVSRSPAEEAKASAPCVIFIDELDSVGGKRIESPMHPYSRQTINQLLAEMDGWVLTWSSHGPHTALACLTSVLYKII